MQKFETKIDIRWADLDPNFHVLHSKYYDFGAYCRMLFLVQNGLTAERMSEMKMGPILFREEATFRRELNFGDTVHINLELTAASENYSRWSMRHHLIKNENKTAAIIQVDGAWMDTEIRKLAVPPSLIAETFTHIPRSEDFKIVGERS